MKTSNYIEAAFKVIIGILSLMFFRISVVEYPAECVFNLILD